jgi:hypothetical protein
MSWVVYGTTFLESQPGSGASFAVTGGFPNAPTSSLKRATGRIYKNQRVFSKKQVKTWHLLFLAKKTNKILKTTSAYTESTDLTL